MKNKKFKFQELIANNKSKGEKKPKYGMRKFSIGFVSCVLGFSVLMSPISAGAVNQFDEENTFIQSIDLEELRQDEIVYREGEIGTKAYSESTNHEELGYAPVNKYNFSDLKFNPENLDKESNTNEIKFEIYAKHNIAASTDNWKINLQIDERLAQYITKIDIQPKETASTQSRRVFVRKNDTLGRSTNIWQVNYVRANNGLFAGGETTDTQVAPEGIITFEKPLSEILEEIGDEELLTEKLKYRIYLTSVQDGVK